MTNKCLAVIAANIPDLVKALQSQGFLLVADLPPIRPEIRRGMIVVRFP
ncbi:MULTISPECIES: hypothetical protein [Pseudomonas]|nr:MULTISPECIES: hypothetical protein [Pseudomonas]UJW20808.1 hypothetical protein L2Y89_17770 [Pseudomonas juntendi]